ncbi:MAG: pyridoxal phosphate-dependent aminotransferase [Alphaproteobacteria bacterium]|nr:pyridoxal phosphate-dependent aminotransferase [Alphaproteobacteria bacterium]
MDFLANRLKCIHPSPTLAMTARAAELKAQGLDVISLSAGEPDFDTPDPIKQGAVEALNKGQTKYTPIEGTVLLRKAIQEKFLKDNQLSYSLDEITVGNGAKQVIFNALLATVQEGDEVIIPAPYWVSYPDMVHICSGKSVIVHCGEEDHFKLTPASLENAITKQTKWLILNSPGNPTGRVYLEEQLRELGEVLLRHPHVYVICDDIYEYLVYDKVAFATLATVVPNLKNRILTVNGVSKSYAMTGWRIGYAGGPKPLIKAITMIQSHSTSNACSISQAAAVTALSGSHEFISSWVQTFQFRRDLALEIINATPGLSCFKPEGAFYLYISCEGVMGKKTPRGQLLSTDNEFVLYLLEEGGIASVSGDSFGLSPYFRISYAIDTELLREACNRIQKAVLALA